MSSYSVLYLEDSDLDAELVLARLEKSDLSLQVDRVSDRDAFEQRLRDNHYDVILSDYQVPRFTGSEAVELASRLQPDVPLIIVSGAMGEELAIETLKQGATDYVLKQRLARLPTAIKRAVDDARDQKALRTSQTAVRETQESLAFALDAAGLGTWELNLETGDFSCTALFAQNLGLPAQTVVTHDLLLSAIHPDDREHVEQTTRQVFASKVIYDIEYRVVWPNGEIHWLNVRGRFLDPAEGHPALMRGVSLDITDRKQSEERLRASEARFRAIVETEPECVKLVAADGTLLQINRAGLQMIEADSLEQVIGKSIFDCIAAEFRSAFRTFHDQVCRGHGGRLEFDIIGLRGTRRHMETNAVPLKDDSGAISHLGITRDVTLRKRSEQALRRSDLQFRQMAERLPNMAWMAQPDGHVFWFNSRWFEYTGTTSADVEGWNWKSVHDPDVLPDVIERWKKSLNSGESFEMVFPIRGSDGTFRPFLTLAQPFRGSNHEILYWFGTNTDISAQKKAEQFLVDAARHERHRAERLTQLASASKSVNTMLSVESVLDVLAAEARRILSSHLAIALVREGQDQPHPLRCVSMSEKYLQLPETPREEQLSFLLETESGISAPLISHSGGSIGRVFVSDKSSGEFTDEDRAVLTQLANIASASMENARLYQLAREQDRRKDEFLATLAHELRNPLAPLRNALGIFRLNPQMRSNELVEMMDRQLGHMVRLIDDLLDISRISMNKMELRCSRIPLSDAIKSAIETSRPLIESARHELNITIPAEPIYLHGDLTRLAQVFSNLLSNSAKYTVTGHISLTVSRQGNEALVSVTDDGIGIPPESLSQIFDMFWQVDRSIERQTGGLGIGLALVKGIAEMHGGSISAYSRGSGQGSTFTVRLPIIPAEAGATPEDAASTARVIAGGKQRRKILVVDDNLDSAASMSMMLNILGSEVEVANDGYQALERYHRFQPDIILMDVGMPRLNGYEAARRIRQLKNGAVVKIVALTGWGHEADRQRSREAGCDAHLVKPVSLNELQSVLTRLFEGQS